MTRNDDLVESLVADPGTASVSQPERAMLNYAIKLTRTPAEMQEADVQALRDAGFDDRALFDINHVTAYYNYVNRIADGLGVELEPFWEDEG